MSRSLYAGASGLFAHQRKLDIVANNLANLNTAGYKSQRVQFADLLYQKVITDANPIQDVFGGRNPAQAGNGVRVSQITRNLEQGTLQSTGDQFDMAIVGRGYFTVSDGIQSLYTRDGSFTLNRDGYLTTGTGHLVQRIGTVGEPTDNSPGVQRPGSSAIRIPLGKPTPGRATTSAAVNGTLPLAATGPKALVLTSASPFRANNAAATQSTLLNDLESNIVDYVNGDTIQISGLQKDGTPFSVTLNVDGTTTLGDVANAINGILTDAVLTLDANGNFVIRENETGTSLTSLTIVDGTNNTGGSSFETHDMKTTTEGKAGDKFSTTIQFYSVDGRAHNLVVNFTKQGNKTWDLEFSMDGEAGTLPDNVVKGIEFKDDGTFRRVTGIGVNDSAITVKFAGMSDNQRISLDFSGLVQSSGNYSPFFNQDGFPNGVLNSFTVNEDGFMEAISTNGMRVPLAQLAIAVFRNENALAATGDNMFMDTISSGPPQLGTGTSGERGSIINGNLEQSNVDIAFEFTQLIIAQRGFSANSRTITVTDNVLQEMINIVR